MNRLIVVLGMHRSGTSAVSRGLAVLGVNLGENLHPAAIDNPKGFWEDRDFLAINEELLAFVGSAYDRLGLINWAPPCVPAIESITARAEKLVLDRCGQYPVFGFKDPRTARLLPFWQSVFANLGCDVRYVIANRNPISIVESLRKRSGFEPEKTFYLWLEHLIPAISRTMGTKRVVVDYDRLLDSPGPELLRMARALGLPEPDPSALVVYKNEFLERELRHTLFAAHEMEAYPGMPLQVRFAYDWLAKLAVDAVAIDSAEIEQVFSALYRDLDALSPALGFMARQDQKMITLSHAVREREQRIAESEQTGAALQTQVQDLLTGNAWLLSQRDAWERDASEHQKSIASLTVRVREAEEELAANVGFPRWIRNHWSMRFLSGFSKRRLSFPPRMSRTVSMAHRQTAFLKEFDKAEFARFRTTYESINPDRPIETANVKFDDTDPRFRQFLESDDDSKRTFVDEILPHLGLFLHGPFPLPGRRVTRSAWDCRGKYGAYEAAGIIPTLAGARVLDVGCNAGYDSFLMSSLGAMEVVGVEPHGFYHQACFLNAVYDLPGVSFKNLGWEDLDPKYLGSFDFVNCLGLIYHVKEPMLLIQKLASVMRPGATLLMESHVLSEDSSQSRFIEGAFWGDKTYWWIFGAECLMGMLRSAGFGDVRMPLKADCDSRNPLNPRVTVEGHPAGARAWFVATKS